MSKEFVLDKVLDKIENKKILKSDDINIKQNENNIRPANNIEDYVTYSNKDISDLGFNVDSIVTGKKCMNKVTSGGVLVSDLKKASSVIEYTNTEKTIGYCFDISDITIRFKNNNFINPFTNKPFSKDFVIQYSDKIRILYKNSSNINVDIDTRKLKLGYLLEKIDENNSVVDKFYNLDEKNMRRFAISNLKIDKKILDAINSKDLVDFIVNEWSEKLLSIISEREVSKTNNNLLKNLTL